MSHTYEHKETRFICNSDLSGDVTIITKNGELDVNGDDIKNFVIDFLKSEYVSNVENMSNDDFMKLLLKK